jgi:hypothetical protein
MGTKVKNIIGMTYGKLTIVKEVDPDFDSWNRKIRKVECVCECGGSRITRLSALRYGATKSCGCILKERKNRLRHASSFTSEYRSYYGMKGRCGNPNHYEYKRYGGRGIKVCDRWLESYENFINDIGPKPSPKHSLDRIDVDGNYEPGNVRWATPKEQRINQRRVKQIK